MRIGVLGAGPAGLYFALLMKKADPGHEVLVIERNPPDATFGWGVVFSEETLGALREADGPSYERITDTFARWGAIDIRYRGQTVRSRGHVFSAIARKRLLQILQERCADLGVELQFHREVPDLSTFDHCDLVVAADGVNSLVRRTLAPRFGPREDTHRTKFAWFGTDLVFDAFTFIFRENEAGLFQVHAYPFDAETSTFIVECPEDTWRLAGLDRMDEAESIAYCEALFGEDLSGHRLLSNRSLWVSFVTLRCESWHADNVVLLGDAAHTAHFTIGSGTKLAMEDAVALAQALGRHADLRPALVDYELERQPLVERFQEAARESASYFENVRRYGAFTPNQFAFNLLTRSGRITHLELERRDPSFVSRVDAEFAAGPSGPVGPGPVVAPPPRMTESSVGGLELPNRVAWSVVGGDDASDGMPGPGVADRVASAVGSGAGLILTELVAVEPQGRITPGTPGLWSDEQEAAWAAILQRVHDTGEARMAVRLGHAGPRGATRPRADGVDRPLRDEGWPLVAASPVPYTRFARRPEPLDDSGLAAVVRRFAEAGRRAVRAGFDLILLDAGHGYLLASLLSPLTNRRADGYGGSVAGRARLLLEVLEAMPAGIPTAVMLLATDWARGGMEVDDAVEVARMLRDRGCALVAPVGGQSVARDNPVYGRFPLVPAADRVRNEAGVPTLVGGNLTTNDEIDTILAAGRADLCILDPRRRG